MNDPAPGTGPREAAGAPAIELPEFTGPLDLLLHLIQKDELSIYDIPIARICDQYHAHLSAMAELDLEIAGEFLWMAAWLLQLKSRMLLPSVESSGEDPRAELVERLVEYRRVKELAGILSEIHVVRRGMWPSSITVDLGEGEEIELDWEDIDLNVICRAYMEAMERFAAAHPPPLEVRPLRYTVERTMRELYGRVLEEGSLPLLRHLHASDDPEEVVTAVVATLELARLGGIHAEQRRPFAEIYLRPARRRLSPEELFAEQTASG
ncbi:MAG TPA: hypothetical protein ENK19_00410 [Acidobacteria bacterium]|nr:hypothetical protein [Acidobacteriota bacterium]